MFRKRNLKTILVVLVIAALLFGYGPILLGLGNAFARGLRTISPIFVFVLGIIVGKVLL